MNRREFVKALAEVSLLGVLAKLPRAEANTRGLLPAAMFDKDCIVPSCPDYIDVSASSSRHTVIYDMRPLGTNAELFEAAYNELALDAQKQPAFELSNDGGDWMLERYKDENGEWQTRAIFGSPPTDLHWDNDPTPGMSYWNGQEWVRM